MKIEKYTSELTLRDGIFFSAKVSEISYPETGNESCFQLEENSFWFRHRNDCIVQVVLKYSPREMFFDVGGGNGFVAQALEDNGISTVVVEPGIQGCLNARERKLEKIICAALEDISFKKNIIPSMGLFDVVEHIEEDVAFFRLIYDIMQPGGHLYITVPAFQWLWSNEDVDAGHFRRYTIKELNLKLEAAGFEVPYATYVFSVLPMPIFLMRTIPSKMGFNRNSEDLEKQKKEHQNKGGVVDNMLSKIWKLEVSRIKEGKRMAFGGSCLVVAKKSK